MKFSVGYQFKDENERPFAQSLCELKDHIKEVYFPWISTETCRASLIDERGEINWHGQAYLEEDLFMLKNSGIELNLLMNGNCYGDNAISKYLKNNVYSIIDHIENICGGVDSITTTSPFIATIVKEKYPAIKTRASINMRIGTIKGMDYIKDIFDGFYIQREHNRDIEYIKEIKKYTDKNNKTLHLLANSGCMSYCSAQTFHDNAVSHEKGILERSNVTDFEIAKCWDYYKNKENWPSLLQNSWIRPEDLHNYEELFDYVKLATRVNQRPLNTLRAYISGEFYGNTLSLLEPNHSKVLGNQYISNSEFPKDFFKYTSTCNKKCHECNYCENVLLNVLKRP